MNYAKMIDLENDFTEEEIAAIIPNQESVEDKIIVQYKLGLSVSRISKENRVSMGKIYEILNRNGVRFRYGKKPYSKSAQRLMTMTKAEKMNLIKDYKDGLPLTAIYAKYDINKHGTYTILDEYNVPRHNETKIKNPKERVIEDDVESIVGTLNSMKKADNPKETPMNTLRNRNKPDKVDVLADYEKLAAQPLNSILFTFIPQ